ncbi:putative transmembrane domain-containing protein [Cryptosporidium canis]|uniref:Transmembrane domain-containing protein n=1 Tax=Cryptosporidium canis TaxID=195482 RepID=A0A9D5HX98_9CRYT|nr:putative transmembrane domain-containing protein [Cryptosporidium canis]
MDVLSFYSLTILILFICGNEIGNAFKLAAKNNTKVTKLGDQNTSTLFPIDAADLLECSKQRGYILLDKTTIVNSGSTNTAKQLHLESIYLNSQFFGIIESIAGTSGNFVGDAISGLQLNRVLDVLREIRVQIYFGDFQDTPDLNTGKLSSISLTCNHGNDIPSLTSYHFSNLCEFTQGMMKRNLLLNQDNICNFQYSDKYLFGEKIKYFNILASLNIPILNYQELDRQFLSLINTPQLYNDQQINLNRYLQLSNELGLSFLINLGIGFFGKLKSSSYYLLIKMVPPDTFWIKDEYYREKQSNSNPIKTDSHSACSKYEHGIGYYSQNTISFVETDKNTNRLDVYRNSLVYLNIYMKSMLVCLGQYSISIYTESKGAKSMTIKIFDSEQNEFKDMDKFEDIENKRIEFKYLNNFISYQKLNKLARIIIINENSRNISIEYKISCSESQILSNLYSNFSHLLNKRLLWSNFMDTSIYSEKYSSGIVFIILVALLLILAPILGLFVIVMKSIVKRYDDSRINHLKVPLTEKTNTKLENTSDIARQSKYNIREYNSINSIEIPLRLKKEFLSPSSSPISSQIVIHGKLYNQLQSPEQLELYSAISNNLSNTGQYNTDTSSSPSTIKSITFKH